MTIGTYDTAYICELVGIPILSQLSRITDKENKGLYRDDRLIIIKEPNGPKLDKYRKKITNALKLLGFKITIITNWNNKLPRRNIKFRKRNIQTFQKKKMIHLSIYTPPQTTHWQSDNSSNINIFNSKKNIYNNALKQVDTHNN